LTEPTIPRPDHRDIALEQSSDDLFDLAEQAARYRVVLVEAIHALADREKQIRARDRTVENQRSEIRALRAEHERRMGVARQEYRKVQAELRRVLATQADEQRAA
jgi:hypothetical protein